MEIRNYQEKDLPQMTEIWNEIVEAANAFPGDHSLSADEAAAMFATQTDTVCACEGDQVLGLYILHPNNIGRCSQIANASYGVSKNARGKGIGRLLVTHSLQKAREDGFVGLQFNAVVCTNTAAIALYEDLGFRRIAQIPNGYRLKDGSYTDTIVFFYPLAGREPIIGGN